MPNATMEDLGPVRSALFVPANRRDWIEKAPKYGADVLVLDLEDATPPAEKAIARDIVRETIPGLRERGQGVWVRVNDLGSGHAAADARAVCLAGVSSICLPKVTGPADVAEADRLLAHAEGANGLPLGTVGIYPLLESASGLLHAEAVFRASTRVRYGGAIAAPGADVEFAVGYRWSDSFLETLGFRSHVLLAARACGIRHPVTGLVTELDEDVTRRFGEQSRSLGYEGMFVIHPSQVPIANAVFMPSEDEYAWSREVLEVYREAERDGHGTALDSSGRLIDFAMLRVAERVSERYRHFLARDARSADV